MTAMIEISGSDATKAPKVRLKHLTPTRPGTRPCRSAAATRFDSLTAAARANTSSPEKQFASCRGRHERTRRSRHLHRPDRTRLRPLDMVARSARVLDPQTVSPRRAHRDHRGCYLPDY